MTVRQACGIDFTVFRCATAGRDSRGPAWPRPIVDFCMTEQTGAKTNGYRHFDVAFGAGLFTIFFARAFAQFLGLRERRSEVRHRVQVHLKEFGIALPPDADQLSSNLVSSMHLSKALDLLDNELGILASRPLTAGQVQRLLGISSGERSAWTKDGRLRQHGSSLIKRGQLISLQTYAPGDIDYLLHNSEVIRDWRKRDLSAADTIKTVDN